MPDHLMRLGDDRTLFGIDVIKGLIIFECVGDFGQHAAALLTPDEATKLAAALLEAAIHASVEMPDENSSG